MRQRFGRVKATPRRDRPALHSLRLPITSTETLRGFTMTTTGPNRILDEFAKLLTDAAGAAQGVRREVETAFKAQAERLLNSMEVVQREEFEAARDMAVKARAENKALAARIDALEARIAELAGATGAGEAAEAAAKPRSKK
jgi:BMFP domain-containing protein YqiC